jgi:cell division septation protein DedD
VTDESHRDAMNDAIRAQRERGNVPKSMLPPDDEPAPVRAAPEPTAPEPEPQPEAEPAPEPVGKRGFLSRLLGR